MRYAVKANAKAGHAAEAAVARRPGASRSLSNQARLRQLGLDVQAKLIVGAVNDPLEREADQAAEQVMAMREPPALAATGKLLSRKCTACAAAPALDDDVTPLVSRSVAGGGRAMDGGTRAFMESRFGRDFGAVRLHTGGAAEAGAAALGARAFTVGRDVVFGAGEYAPGSAAGQKLLAHELAHTVQQGAAGDAALVSRSAAPALSEGDGLAVQKAVCGNYGKNGCGGQDCEHSSGGAGFCRWSGTIANGCICIKIEKTVADPIRQYVVPALQALGVMLAAAAIIALVACFASGACEVGALIAAIGYAAAMAVMALVSKLGLGGDSSAATAANDAGPGAPPAGTADPAAAATATA